MELLFERADKFGETRAKSGKADRLNGLLPGVLVVRSHRKNLFQKHLRGEVCAVRGEFRTTIAAQNTSAYDRRGKGRTRDAREKRRLLIIEHGDGILRRAREILEVLDEDANHGIGED